MTMPATLVLERLPGRLRLYLGGDLQFDTDDEAIYHERLVHPALMAARARFAGPLDVLVLGGGDGLAVRELLRHEAVRSIRVVDLNADVVALARSELRQYNAAGLDDPRVEVTVADARDVLETAGRFHAIVSDLTFPTSPDDCALWTRDWFARLRTHLHPGGLMTLNGISPERTPAAFRSLYQTLRTAGLHALPAHYDLPNFAELGYDPWGLFLASDRPIGPDEIRSGAMPAGVSTLDRAALEALFRFSAAWAEGRVTARPNCDGGRALFEALSRRPTGTATSRGGRRRGDFLPRLRRSDRAARPARARRGRPRVEILAGSAAGQRHRRPAVGRAAEPSDRHPGAGQGVVRALAPGRHHARPAPARGRPLAPRRDAPRATGRRASPFPSLARPR